MDEAFETVVCGLMDRDHAGILLEEKGIDMTYLGRGKYDPRMLVDLYRLVKKFDPQILHLHGYGACSYGRVIGSITGRPTILHEHYVDHNIPAYQSLIELTLSPLTQWALVGCQAVKDALVKKRWIPERKIKVIYPGIPLEEFRTIDEEKKSRLRQEFGVDKDGMVVGTVARLHEQKGHTYFIDAMPEILNKHPSTRFLIVGDGHLFEQLEQQASKVGVARNVIFTGYREDIPELLSIMDIKVIASLYEATTLTVFEAMALGKAIVSTHVDGLKEIITDGENGLLVSPADPRALAEKINLLIEDADLREKIQARSRADSEKYDRRVFVKKLEDFYYEILRGTEGTD